MPNAEFSAKRSTVIDVKGQCAQMSEQHQAESGNERWRRSGRGDKELYLQFRDQADEQAFDELVHRYEGELYRYLRNYLRDATLAEDVFQATFVRVYRKASLFDEQRPFRPWLYSVATHLAIDALRKLGRHQAVSLDRPETDGGPQSGSLGDQVAAKEPTPFDEAVAKERREWTRQAVDQLPEPLRLVVILVFFQGLKYSEAAQVLNVPLGTIKSRLHSAIKRLDQAWHERHVVLSNSGSPGDSQASEDAPDGGSGNQPRPRVESALHTLRKLVILPGSLESPSGLARSTCLWLREQRTAGGQTDESAG